ncbi:hypothetical protein CSC62_16360 [Pseudoxanthomonas jiangsuensis]|uniref:hypothetical protein n=1 Tax=Pseudoxanthomonas jiangsuensis TaxID=619688 RepID=UPI001391FE61|nr:hypothetical protein [Pseudoxanthomonas jiangsuensis]KAF1691197.1 hypothetical protein CSC62_16360 [Pseudoxanthomonas jiangsuensis]
MTSLYGGTYSDGMLMERAAQAQTNLRHSRDMADADSAIASWKRHCAKLEARINGLQAELTGMNIAHAVNLEALKTVQDELAKADPKNPLGDFEKVRGARVGEIRKRTHAEGLYFDEVEKRVKRR